MVAQRIAPKQGSTQVVTAASPDVYSTSVVVSNGQSLSAAIALDNGKPAGLQFPSNIDSATKVTFQLSYDGGTTYDNMYDTSGTEYQATIAASRAVPIEFKDFFGATHMKIRLGTAASPTTATADRTIKVALVP